MMKRLALLVAMVLAGCGSSSGTFVLVHFEAGNAPPTGVREVDLDLDLNGVTAKIQVKDGDKDLAFPSSKSLQINSGSGLLGITAVAHNAAGTEVTRAVSWVQVTRDSTIDINVVFGVINPKPGMDPAHLTSDVTAPPADFGTTGVGAPRNRVITIMNTGTGPTAGMLRATFSGPDASSFSIEASPAPNCQGDMQIAVNAVCQIKVVFTPATAGAKSADFTVKADSGAMVVVPLIGAQ